MRESNHQIFRSILVYALALLLVWVMIPVTSLAKTSGQPDEALLSDTQSDPAVQRKGAGARLSGNELRAYNLLIDPVREVTEGKRTSTAFTLSFADVTGTDGSWTAEDLGLTTLAENGEPTAEAKEKVDELVSFDADYVCDCLGYNFPFDTFWYDTGCCPDLETSYEIDGDTLTGYHTVKMYAMEDCSLNGELKTTEVGDIAPAAAEAAATAKQIVADNAGKSVREQLAAYRDAICELVTYNDEAAADNNRPVGYVDQLIWVFDRAPDTNVVCGGYSKAFKYLCDLTWPDSDKVECLLVDGLMQGFNIEESHMWNIVRLDDGKNYLVDVTNCETGSVGEPDKLFLASADSGSMTTGGYYGFDIDYWITYQYSYFLFHYYDREQISVSVKTLKDVEIVSHDELSFIDWTDELAAGQNGEGSNASNSLPSQPGNWHLTTDVTLTEDWQAPLGVINLCLNGRTISFDNDHKIAIGGGRY